MLSQKWVSLPIICMENLKFFFEKMSEIAWFNIYVIIVKKVRVKQGIV
jgi:hypothetical protein